MPKPPEPRGATRHRIEACPEGVRAALGWSVETATLAREHNDANVLGLGGRMHNTEEAFAIVSAFLATPFSGAPRHQRRIDQVAEYESDR